MACSSLISSRGTFIAKLSNRCRTQYPQSRGHPITWLRLSPLLRFSITSSSSGRRLARCCSFRIGSGFREVAAGLS
jgi:hypothetical protein